MMEERKPRGSETLITDRAIASSEDAEGCLDAASPPRWLCAFADESNRIEGEHGATEAEIAALADFLDAGPSIAALERLVGVAAPRHRLRDAVGLDVHVGRDCPPRGAPEIRERLEDLLAGVRSGRLSPFAAHIAYERLHPFTDGNGRSGRALWLWAILDRGGQGAAQARELGFLLMFYYQAIQEAGDVQRDGTSR